MAEIKIACKGSVTLVIDDLHAFQNNLKSLSKGGYDRLRKEILKTGYAFPIHVWNDGEKYNVVAGHQRLNVLRELQREKHLVPPIPCVEVFAKDLKEAKRRVLQDASQYGTVEREGLYQFQIENDILPGDLAESFSLPEINIPSFNAEFFMDDVGLTSNSNRPNAVGAKEISADEFQNFKHNCPRCGFHFD